MSKPSSGREISVAVRFPSEEAARQWMAWHDGAGEQWHWEHCGERGEPKMTFDYDYDKLMITAQEAE